MRMDKLQFVYTSDCVSVIRCVSCKWWNGSTLGTAHRCAALHIATTGEFYCAAAERKSNAYADKNGAEYAVNDMIMVDREHLRMVDILRGNAPVDSKIVLK